MWWDRVTLSEFLVKNRSYRRRDEAMKSQFRFWASGVLWSNLTQMHHHTTQLAACASLDQNPCGLRCNICNAQHMHLHQWTGITIEKMQLAWGCWHFYMCSHTAQYTNVGCVYFLSFCLMIRVVQAKHYSITASFGMNEIVCVNQFVRIIQSSPLNF